LQYQAAARGTIVGRQDIDALMGSTAEKSAAAAEKSARGGSSVTPTLRDIDRLVAERMFGVRPCRASTPANLGSAGGPALIHGDWEQGTPGGPPHYGLDIGAARQSTPMERSDASTKGRVTHTQATAPLAICLVALRASGVDV
jgi:hypothetical protein